VDSSIPSARARRMLALAGVGLVLSPGDAVFAGCETLDSRTLRCLCEDRHAPLLLPVPAAPEDLLYILFTSGSTGDPKGVRVTRRNVEFFLDWLRGLLDTAAGPVLNLASFSFDLSVADLWLSLTCGRCECALEQPLLSDYPALFARISDVAPALAVMTPSFAEVLLADPSFHAARFPTLCELLFCGEPLRPSTVLRLCERFPDLRIVNSYGPTECTVAACGCEISRELAREGALPIGVSGPDSPIVLLNAENRPCADCEVGELVITGERVAAGYLGSERGGFCSFDGRPAYRTGDLGFRRGERLYYSGRVDRQLKIHGFRIEP
ncbi:MAG: AMP-binding protein, partial [Oscillospiraceae bacterium]